jgi:hypothetical protein
MMRPVILVLAASAASVCTSWATAHSSGTDTHLCPFPVTVELLRGKIPHAETAVLEFTLEGPTRILLRNDSTRSTVVLDSPGTYSVDRAGSVGFHGHNVWYRGLGEVPFLATDGPGTFVAPRFTLSPGTSRASVIDPCALLAPSPPDLGPRTTPAPWPAPPYTLSRIAHAQLIPVLGGLVRHDHVHLDVVVDGRKVAVPAGIGLAEPVDRGPCKPPTPAVSECSAGDYFTAFVANSPLHTHSSSGIIHIEADRAGRYTLGQFFDEWGVRLTQTCLGGYCAGRGKQLGVFVDGHRANGALRRVVLGNRREIAVVFGSRRDFRSVSSTYRQPWPGLGCGGPGEVRC